MVRCARPDALVRWSIVLDERKRAHRGSMSADVSSNVSPLFVELVVSPVRLAVASAFRPGLKADATAGRMGRPPFVEPEQRSQNHAKKLSRS